MNPARSLALALIRLYQRHLSPRKGFACAHRRLHGGASCSHLGLRVIRRHGVWRGLALLDERLRRCGVAGRRLRAAAGAVRVGPPALQGQGGFCDVDCGACEAFGPEGCDVVSCGDKGCRALSFLGDAASCGGDCCDWRRRGSDGEEAASNRRSR